MSPQVVEHALRNLIEQKGYSLEEGLSILFNGFDCDALIKANNKSEQKLFSRAVGFAMKVADFRSSKMATKKKHVLVSDFVPALSHIGELAEGRYRFSTSFDKQVRSILTQCCPWC
jgi:hypothetical protein